MIPRQDARDSLTASIPTARSGAPFLLLHGKIKRAPICPASTHFIGGTVGSVLGFAPVGEGCRLSVIVAFLQGFFAREGDDSLAISEAPILIELAIRRSKPARKRKPAFAICRII